MAYFEFGASQCFSKVFAIKERFNVESDGGLGRKSSLGTFDFTLEFAHSTKVGSNILAIVLSLPDLDKVVNDTVVKVFTTKMSVTSSSQNFENAVFDGKKRDIESSSSQVVDDNLAFSFAVLSVKTVGDSCGGRLVDNTEDVKTSDDTSVLCCLTLSVVEVSWDAAWICSASCEHA